VEFNASKTGCTLEHLQNAIVEALKLQWDGDLVWQELLDISFVGTAKQARWDRMDRRARAFWLLEQLRASTAIVPGYICVLADVPCGSTYARLAEQLEMDLG